MAGEKLTFQTVDRIISNDPQEFIDNPDILSRWIYSVGTQFQNVVQQNFTASNGVTLIGTDFQHSDTSSIGNVSGTGTEVIADVTFDTFGHVQTFTKRSLTASNGVIIVGADFQHSNTSSVGNVSATVAQVVSTVTFDTFGHVQSFTTRTLTPANIGAEPAFTKNTAFNKDFGSNTDEIIEAGGAASNIDELVTVADQMLFTTGPDVYSVTTITSFGR